MLPFTVIPFDRTNGTMNIRYASFLLATSICFGASAQVSLSATNNVPAIGSIFAYHQALYAPPPAAGAGVLFDYSTLSWWGNYYGVWITPSDYSNPAAFPTATMAFTKPADTAFYAVTANGLERVGERQLILGLVDVEVPYSDASLDLKLPLSYLANWNDNVAATFTTSGNPATRSGTIHGEADAWGTMTLPGGGAPISVIRVYTYVQEINNVNPGFPITVTHKRHQYDYYANFLKTPLLRVYSDSLLSSLTNSYDSGIEWLQEGDVGIAQAAQSSTSMGLFPNPATNTVTLSLSVPASNGATLIMRDALGQEVRRERLGANVWRQDLNVADLPIGTYSVSVMDARGIVGTSRFVKN
jgi:Secretion system C-terminal sorting domain